MGLCSWCLLVWLLNFLFCGNFGQEGNCDSSQFECNDGTCIPGTWECDYEKDCSSGEDESNCESCDVVGYKCHDSDRCIAPQWKCDNWTDCTMGDDELYCNECNANSEFECYLDSIDTNTLSANRRSGQCIAISKQCDYRQDCYNGEDETDCPLCEENGFECDNNATCIANIYVCDGILDCNDWSDECGCKSGNLVNYTLPHECAALNNEDITQSPSNEPTQNVIVPEFYYCPESTIFLGFLTYNDSDNSTSGNINRNINSNVNSNVTQVFWTEPTLANRDQDALSIEISQEHESGDLFGAGFHYVKYTASTTPDAPLFRYDICTYTILVLQSVKQSVINDCGKGSEIDWYFITDNDYYNVLDYKDGNKYNSIEKTIHTDSMYYRPSVRAQCTATVVLIDNENDSVNRKNEIVEIIADWIETHWIFAIGAFAAVILLIVILCCAVFYFARKNAEYKEYDAAADDEASNDLTDDSMTDQNDEYDVATHGTHSGIHSGLHSGMHSGMHGPPMPPIQASLHGMTPHGMTPHGGANMMVAGGHHQRQLSQISQLSRASGSNISMNNNSQNNSQNNDDKNGSNMSSSHGYPMIPIDRNGVLGQRSPDSQNRNSIGNSPNGMNGMSGMNMKPLTRRRSVLGIAIDNLHSGTNDLVGDNEEDNEDAQLLVDEWNKDTTSANIVTSNENDDHDMDDDDDDDDDGNDGNDISQTDDAI